jgi:hypothetical protein
MRTPRILLTGVVMVGGAGAAVAQTSQPGSPVQVGKATTAGILKAETPTELAARLKTEVRAAREDWEQAPNRPEQYTRHVAAARLTLKKLSPEGSDDPLKSQVAAVGSVGQIAVTSTTPVVVPPYDVAKYPFLKPDVAELKRLAEAKEALAKACKEANRLTAEIANTSPTGEKGKTLFDALAKEAEAIEKAVTPPKK